MKKKRKGEKEYKRSRGKKKERGKKKGCSEVCNWRKEWETGFYYVSNL